MAAGPGIVIERDSATSAVALLPLAAARSAEHRRRSRRSALRRGSAGARVGRPRRTEQPQQPHRLILDDRQPPRPGFDQPPALDRPRSAAGQRLPAARNRGRVAGSRAPGLPATPAARARRTSICPNWPDAVLALDVDPSGSEGWVVGGQTGGIVQGSADAPRPLVSQTASALRLGAGPPPPQSAGAPIPIPAGQATFAVGGDAQCAAPCADFANEGLGPDAWLSGAARARRADPGPARLPLHAARGSAEGAGRVARSAEAFERELAGLRGRPEPRGSAAGLRRGLALGRRQPQGACRRSTRRSAASRPPGSAPSGTPAPPAGSGAYAFESAGSGGTGARDRARLLLLRAPAGELEMARSPAPAGRQSAAVPAIVMGNANLSDPHRLQPRPGRERGRRGAARTTAPRPTCSTVPAKTAPSRSARAANAIPAFGSGTLGYVLPPGGPERIPRRERLPARERRSRRSAMRATNRAPVTATLTPSIAQLALDATDGTLLRRSQVALFQGLARRPAGGLELQGVQAGRAGARTVRADPGEVHRRAAAGSSSRPATPSAPRRPDIGNFVEQEPNNPNPRAVLQGPDGKPIADSQSGPVLRLQRRHDDGLDHHRRAHLLRAGDRPGRQRRAAVWHGAAGQPAGRGGRRLRRPPLRCRRAPHRPPRRRRSPWHRPRHRRRCPRRRRPRRRSCRTRPRRRPRCCSNRCRPWRWWRGAAASATGPGAPDPALGHLDRIVFQAAVAEEKREDEEAVESARNSMAIYDPKAPTCRPRCRSR